MNKLTLTVQCFACLVLVGTVAIEFIEDGFYFTQHFHLSHISVCALRAFFRCPLLLSGELFLMVCPVLAQAVRGWLPLRDQHRHRCLNCLRQDMLPG